MLKFDVVEHNGAFGGAKSFFEHALPGGVHGVMISYPGPGHRGTASAPSSIHIHEPAAVESDDIARALHLASRWPPRRTPLSLPPAALPGSISCGPSPGFVQSRYVAVEEVA